MPPKNTQPSSAKKVSNFRRFFFRGLGILLPTILTIWIVIAVYQFVDQKIASPINTGVREVVLITTQWPEADPKYHKDASDPNLKLPPDETSRFEDVDADRKQEWLDRRARRRTLEDWWRQYSIGNWAVLDLIGLLIAAFLIYSVGAFLGSLLGRKMYRRVEEFIRHLPIIKAVYPYVKQVTDFLFGNPEEQQMRFDRVVAVEYPRRGIWSVGLVTGRAMSGVEARNNHGCLTVFIPSSPTPFTGYTIMVPEADTIDLPISIDDALRFTVSGGVILPENQVDKAIASDNPSQNNQ